MEPQSPLWTSEASEENSKSAENRQETTPSGLSFCDGTCLLLDPCSFDSGLRAQHEQGSILDQLQVVRRVVPHALHSEQGAPFGTAPSDNHRTSEIILGTSEIILWTSTSFSTTRGPTPPVSLSLSLSLSLSTRAKRPKPLEKATAITA